MDLKIFYIHIVIALKSHSDVIKLYNKCSVLVLPSLSFTRQFTTLLWIDLAQHLFGFINISFIILAWGSNIKQKTERIIKQFWRGYFRRI